MNPDHQRLLDRLGEEDSFIERKPPDPNGREIWETIIAFANSVPEGRSGLVFVGVSNRGEILGIEDPDRSALKYHNVAKKYCYPAIDDPRPLYHSGRPTGRGA